MSKNIRSTTKNSLEYTGIVKLSQYTKGKRFTIAEIHNEGGKPLFNFLADCLAGNFASAKTDVPTKILLLNVDKEKNIIEAAENTSFIYLLTNPEKVYSEDAGIVKYSFIIPQEYFAAGNANGAIRFNAIGLYTNSAQDAKDFAAKVEVDTSKWSLSISSVLVLDWELHISNYESKENF
jgi:hypothetical protein